MCGCLLGRFLGPVLRRGGGERQNRQGRGRRRGTGAGGAASGGGSSCRRRGGFEAAVELDARLALCRAPPLMPVRGAVVGGVLVHGEVVRRALETVRRDGSGSGHRHDLPRHRRLRPPRSASASSRGFLFGSRGGSHLCLCCISAGGGGALAGGIRGRGGAICGGRFGNSRCRAGFPPGPVGGGGGRRVLLARLFSRAGAGGLPLGWLFDGIPLGLGLGLAPAPALLFEMLEKLRGEHIRVEALRATRLRSWRVGAGLFQPPGRLGLVHVVILV
mmetsp:Transcript_23195/g.57528  ORF Transcript_23195/g.57528 Transcript_23195/m.57528 type:complete len:274 (+) Transcript_23195:323-1144(+)